MAVPPTAVPTRLRAASPPLSVSQSDTTNLVSRPLVGRVRSKTVKRFHVQFDIDVPDDATAEQVEEWSRYMCGDTGAIEGNNPLIDRSFDPVFNTFKMTTAND
jgi:hypothetical protein